MDVHEGENSLPEKYVELYKGHSLILQAAILQEENLYIMRYCLILHQVRSCGIAALRSLALGRYRMLSPPNVLLPRGAKRGQSECDGHSGHGHRGM